MPKAQDENGWLDRKAAEGMFLLVEEALGQPIANTPPFQAFLDMMKCIDPKEGTTLLDVGCGVGGYAALVGRFYPGIRYAGCDISPHMIDLARWAFGASGYFFICDALELDREGQPDIILASSLIEVCPNWRAILRHLCSLQFQWFILHRVRIWNDPAHPTTDRVYTTLYRTPSFEVVHNRAELLRLTRDAGCVNTYTITYQMEPATRLVSMLLEKEDK